MKIDINKNYRTVDGKKVRIICIDRKSGDEFNIVALVEIRPYYEQIRSYNEQGYPKAFDSNDVLVEITPYDDFSIDEKVIVWATDINKASKRHFAGVSHGTALCFEQGKTSFSTNDKTGWPNCLKVNDFIKQYPENAKEMNLI